MSRHQAVEPAHLGGRLPSQVEVREGTAHCGPAAAVAHVLLLRGPADGAVT